MDIDDALNKTAALSSTPTLKRDLKTLKPSADSTLRVASDSVRLSPQYQALAQTVANSSSFNADKVEAIKKAITNGSFSVDAGKIADAVLNTARDLIKAVK